MFDLEMPLNQSQTSKNIWCVVVIRCLCFSFRNAGGYSPANYCYYCCGSCSNSLIICVFPNNWCLFIWINLKMERTFLPLSTPPFPKISLLDKEEVMLGWGGTMKSRVGKNAWKYTMVEGRRGICNAFLLAYHLTWFWIIPQTGM